MQPPFKTIAPIQTCRNLAKKIKLHNLIPFLRSPTAIDEITKLPVVQSHLERMKTNVIPTRQ